MRIDIITILPELMRSPFEASIMKRAIEKGLVEVHFHNLRDYTKNKRKSVDDYQFGGGAGMVMMSIRMAQRYKIECHTEVCRSEKLFPAVRCIFFVTSSAVERLFYKKVCRSHRG